MSRRIRIALLLLISVLAAGCAKHSSSSPFASPYTTISGSNVLALAMDSENRLIASVEVCVPGTNNCQTIPNIVVDTGSSGLRLFASQLTLALPASADDTGNPIGECAQFPTSYDWGWVGTADIVLADEKASAVPVQVVADATFPGTPVNCSSSGLTANDSTTTFGANGVLGVGVLDYDCGANCSSGSGTTVSYYDCPKTSGVCAQTAVEIAKQVQNPVALFATDNNGVIVSLPAVGGNGSIGVVGTLTFGIGTEGNNKIASSVPIYTTSSAGDLTATYNSDNYTNSYLASGLAGTGILTSTLIGGMTDCPVDGTATGYYCGGATLATTVTGANSTSTTTGTTTTTTATTTVDVVVEDAANLFSSTNTAFNDLAGPVPNAVIYGLPFFFGRDVYVAISGQSTSAGIGPYYGF